MKGLVLPQGMDSLLMTHFTEEQNCCQASTARAHFVDSTELKVQHINAKRYTTTKGNQQSYFIAKKESDIQLQ